jgi:RHS repeat-associated protein
LPSQTVDFRYDGLRQRVEKKTENSSTIYAGGGFYERRASPSGISHVFHVVGVGRRVAQVVWGEVNGQVTSRTTEYLHADHLGSVETVTSTSGASLGNLRFDPFGKHVETTAPWQAKAPGSGFPGNVRHGFTGHEHDFETGLVNARGRIYDPATGHFLTPDPLVAAPAFGPAHNRYAYVYNNPTSLTDSSGFFPDDPHDPDCAANPNCIEDRASMEGDAGIVTILGGAAVGGWFLLREFGDDLLKGAEAAWDWTGRAVGDTGDAIGGLFSDDNGGQSTSGGPSGTGAHSTTGNSYLRELGEAFVNAVPGAYHAGLSSQAWDRGEYLDSVILYGAALADAALGMASFGTASLLKGGAVTTTQVATRGAVRGGETAATRAGRAAHKAFDPGPGFQKEFRLPSGRRPDAVNFETKQVLELKPNNPKAIRGGERQVQQYVDELNELYGGGFTGRVVTY